MKHELDDRLLRIAASEVEMPTSDEVAVYTVPLVVDLDGTLTPIDTLWESLAAFLKAAPLNLLRLPLLLARGRAHLKQVVASRIELAVDRIPYRQALIEYLKEQRTLGRKIVLATAAHQSIAEAVAKHLGLFDQVIATSDGRNLKGAAKLEQIRGCVGDRFVYAGDSAADLPIWRAAHAAILVGASPPVVSTVRGTTPIEHEIPADRIRPHVWFAALRAHQWVKNLLIFVPLLTSFGFLDTWRITHALVGFLAFSGAASATYLFNDLMDIDNDRASRFPLSAHSGRRSVPACSGSQVQASQPTAGARFTKCCVPWRAGHHKTRAVNDTSAPSAPLPVPRPLAGRAA